MPGVTYLNNADLFGMLPPPYYLDRRHHFGVINASDITGIQDLIISIITNSSIYIDVSALGGITTDLSTSHVWYDSALSPSLTMPIAVGGYAAGTPLSSIYGDNVTTILDTLLFGGNMYPTYVAPSSSFSVNPATVLYEVGATPTLVFTISYDPGEILLGGVYQADRAGAATSYNYTGTPLTTPSASNTQTATSYTVTLGVQTWTGSVNYAEGPQPLDAAGNPYESPLPAGTTASDSVSIEGVYPLFATTVDINTLTQQSLVSMSETIVEFDGVLVAESGGSKQKFDVELTWAASLSGIRTYNSLSGTWDYQEGNVTAALARWTTSSVTHTIQGNVINYTRYTYNGVNRTAIPIRLEF